MYKYIYSPSIVSKHVELKYTYNLRKYTKQGNPFIVTHQFYNRAFHNTTASHKAQNHKSFHFPIYTPS